MTRLRIVHAVFSSKLAGGEQHCADLANAQADLGHEVHVVGPAGAQVANALSARVRYHGFRFPLLRGWRLRRLACSLGADVVHGHLGPACKATACATPHLRVGTLHVGYKPHHHAKMDGVICVNIKQVDTLRDYQGPHQVIYNWAPERGHRAPDADASANVDLGKLRSELGIAGDVPVVVSVGRLHPSKGMHSLVQAFQVYAPAKAHLVLIGEGPQRQELETLAAGDPRIHLIGFRWDVDTLLADATLYVSASLEEQFPLSMLEAMRAGLPIVATATQGACEMLSPAQSAIVPIGNIPAMGQAIANALVPGAEGVQRHIQYDMSRFDRSTAVKATLDFYADVAQHRGATQPKSTGTPLEDLRV